MIEYKKKEKMVKYDENYYNDLKKLVEEYSKKELEEIDLELLIEKTRTFIDNIQIYDGTITTNRRETEEDSKKYFGENFIKQFEHIKKIIEQSNCKLLIHGTSPKLLNSIALNGLYLVSDLDLTTYICGPDDNFIYSKLLNWEHHEVKGLVLIAIPNECLTPKDRKPLLNINNNDDGKPKYLLKPEFIIGIIDVTKKEILLNPLYNRNHDYKTIDITDEAVINPMFYTEEELNDSKKETKTIRKQQNNKEFLELIELFEKTEQSKTDNEVYKECINELMGLFSGIEFELNKLLIGENITLERWNEYNYASTLEKLIEINNKKHKTR